ncbi:hypothetical protein C5S29_02535 [ANME-1 cluster archaeon GoMg3.2]|nr:hypothetical protein [ANME-1 cluster archaeon GoMg3.2]
MIEINLQPFESYEPKKGDKIYYFAHAVSLVGFLWPITFGM